MKDIDTEELRKKTRAAGKSASETSKKIGKAAGERAKRMDKPEIARAVGIVLVSGIAGLALITPSGTAPIAQPEPGTSIQQPADDYEPSEELPTEEPSTDVDQPMDEEFEGYVPVGESEPEVAIEEYRVNLGFDIKDGYGDTLDASKPIDIKVFNDWTGDIVWAARGTVGDVKRNGTGDIKAENWSDGSTLEFVVNYDGIEVSTYINPADSPADADPNDGTFSVLVEVVVLDDYVQVQAV